MHRYTLNGVNKKIHTRIQSIHAYTFTLYAYIYTEAYATITYTFKSNQQMDILFIAPSVMRAEHPTHVVCPRVY